MNELNEEIPPETLTQAKKFARKHWKMFLIEGIIFWILGMLAIILPLASGLMFEILIGIVFTIGGIFGIIRSITTANTPGRVLSLFIAILFLISGIFLLAEPLRGLLALTMLLGIFFLIEGLAKISYSFSAKQANAPGLFLFDGILSIIIALIIWAEWPMSAVWFLGLIIGIKLIFVGISFFFFALALKNSPENIVSSETVPEKND